MNLTPAVSFSLQILCGRGYYNYLLSALFIQPYKADLIGIIFNSETPFRL